MSGLIYDYADPDTRISTMIMATRTKPTNHRADGREHFLGARFEVDVEQDVQVHILQADEVIESQGTTECRYLGADLS